MEVCMSKFLSFLILCLLSLSAQAFGNEDVVQLLTAGMEEDVVLNAIGNANPTTFDTSATGLIALKKAGASSAIIQKVIVRQGAASAPNTSAMGMNGGDCRFESGGMEGRTPLRADGKLIGLKSQRPGKSTNVNVGSAFANVLTLGLATAKASSSLEVPGAHATTRIADKMPEFLDLMLLPGYPSDDLVVLVRMTVKGDVRTVQVMSGESSLGGGDKAHADYGPNTRIAVITEKVTDLCTWHGTRFSQYRMRPAVALEPGEYALLFANKVIDFGVD